MTLATSGITFIPTLPSRPWGICNMHTQRTETFKSLEVGRVKVQSNHYFFNLQLLKKLSFHHDLKNAIA